MAEPKDDERDEEWFKEVYGKEYTGPVKPVNERVRDNPSLKKRPITEASVNEPDEDDVPLDPNAVPTDFTSREAKVWEAKAKAIERNWKKKKEEELICRICGEYGHFSQGCPSTLGVNRKQNEIVEKIPVKDKRLKPRIIGTAGATIQGIEKDTGCRLKLEDNLAAGNGSFFVRISGNNRVMIGKAVDAVKKLLDQVQHDRKPQNSYRSHGLHNHGPNVSPLVAAQMQHISSQQLHHDPSMQHYSGQDTSYYGDGQHSNIEQMSELEGRRQWEAGIQNGSFPVASYSKGDRTYQNAALNSKDEDHGPEMEAGYDRQSMSQTLEVLEHKFALETMQLTKELIDAEDKENARHRECMKDIQEQYQQKMVSLRAQQGKRREEFLRQEAQFMQQQYQQYQQPQPQPQPQSGLKYYNHDMGGPMSGGSNSSALEQLGYGVGSADRNGLRGGYGSFRGEGGYDNSPYSYRNSGYESDMIHPRNQGYDAGPYRY